MQNETNFSPYQSLQLIEGMINEAKNRLSENGHLYLLWGWIIMFCSVIHFFAIQFHLLAHPEIVWMLTWVTIIYQLFYLRKHKKRDTIKTYTDQVYGYLWIAFGIMMFITMFILGKQNTWNTMYPMILVLYGMPTFLSGIILRIKPLKIGGLCCWSLAIISTFTPWPYHLLFLSAAVLAAWIIPGYYLNAKFKKQTL